MTAIMEFLDTINAFVWGPPMMIILVGTGVFLTLRTGGLQFTKIGYGWRLLLKGFLKKDLDQRGEGEITPFQSLTSVLAATIGNGKTLQV